MIFAKRFTQDYVFGLPAVSKRERIGVKKKSVGMIPMPGME